MKVLVTGGAGFIGSHVVETLTVAGHRVVVLDALDAQVHSGSGLPQRLGRCISDGSSEFVLGRVEDKELLRDLARDCDAIVHLAAAVGVGQSAYQPHHYTACNALGTASVLDAIASGKTRVERLVVASSISNYGEGTGWNPARRRHVQPVRSLEDVALGRFEVYDPEDGVPTEPVATPETYVQRPTSIYGITKRYTEEAAIILGGQLGLSVVALRFANVFGPGQSLTNPYTGVIPNFCARLMAGQPALVFEDGAQKRDFVHVADVAAAVVDCVDNAFSEPMVLNIGSGRVMSLLDVLDLLQNALGTSIEPYIPGVCRKGDVRHIFPDITRARTVIDYRPQFDLAAGLGQIIDTLGSATIHELGERALAELERHGLVVEAATRAHRRRAVA